MKTISKYFAGTMLSAAMTISALAQSPTAPQPQSPSTPQTTQVQPQEPKALNDPAMSQRLQTDLNTRNNQTADQPVAWFDSGNGYYASYAIGTDNYLSWYDKQGNYMETLTKKDWKDVPVGVKSAYDQTPYKSQDVTGYWIVSDPGKKGYYIETQDKDGKVSRIWADDKGKFSTTPSNKPIQ